MENLRKLSTGLSTINPNVKLVMVGGNKSLKEGFPGEYPKNILQKIVQVFSNNIVKHLRLFPLKNFKAFKLLLKFFLKKVRTLKKMFF